MRVGSVFFYLSTVLCTQQLFNEGIFVHTFEQYLQNTYYVSYAECRGWNGKEDRHWKAIREVGKSRDSGADSSGSNPGSTMYKLLDLSVSQFPHS